MKVINHCFFFIHLEFLVMLFEVLNVTKGGVVRVENDAGFRRPYYRYLFE
jgi:hypothetical protein